MTLFDAALGVAFAPSEDIVIQSSKFLLDFQILVTGGPAHIEWYCEFSEDASIFFREVAENVAGGIVSHPLVVRSFKQNDGTFLPIGTHLFSVPLDRSQQIGRIQIRVASGAARAKVTAPYGFRALVV